MSEEVEKLFKEFPPVSIADWEEVIKKDLKGADYNKSLVWNTHEEIKIKPYYTSEDLTDIGFLTTYPGAYPYVRGQQIESNKWEIRQDIFVDDTYKANIKALNALNNGATSIGFDFIDDFEIPAAEFTQLIKGIDLKTVEINFNAIHGVAKIFPLLENEVKSQKIDGKKVRGSISFDPLGNMSLKGNFCKTEEQVFNKAAELIEKSKSALPTVKIIAINGKYFHNAGASAVQELGFSLSMANQYISRILDRGIKIDDIAPKMKFNFAVGANYFMEIAKIRAARYLWSKMIGAYQPQSEDSLKINIHCSVSEWNMTTYDPFVNVLRGTTESMSAIIAGTNSLTNQPFDKQYQNTEEFSERIARNTQIILKEEAYLDIISDPSAGSYYIESLTNSIAEESWKLFLKVEDLGGYISAFKENFIQSSIEAVAIKRDQNIAQRREIFLGTNQYPNNSERIKENIDFNIYNQTIGTEKDILAHPLKQYRGARAFEELRLKTEISGKTPKVCMFPYGNLAMRKARSMFSCNFFACAGFETIDNKGFDSIDEGVSSSLNAKADIVVICSSDDEYALIVPEIYEKLKEKAIIVVAGAPACMEDLKSKGIKHFISVKSNVLEELKNYQKLLNI